MIDDQGYRPNVGIIICNDVGQVLWAKRIGQDAWQFPQGGTKQGESPEHALYRELQEEVGLAKSDVQILGCTRGWLRYRLPKRMIRQGKQPVCVGQKQKWYLLKLVSGDASIKVDANEKPEFDGWNWVSYWFPLGEVVAFKRDVYRRAMTELSPKIARLQRKLNT